ncbi:MAG: SH3 domain-containing protein [Anaerolineales bacterium]
MEFRCVPSKSKRTCPRRNSDPNPTPDPVPDDEDINWYRMTTASLKVREGPGLTYDSIGLTYLGELVEKLDTTADGVWFKIRNSAGTLTGWCASEYLISVHAPVEGKKRLNTRS